MSPFKIGQSQAEEGRKNEALTRAVRELVHNEPEDEPEGGTDEPDYKAPSNRDELAAMLHKYASKGGLL